MSIDKPKAMEYEARLDRSGEPMIPRSRWRAELIEIPAWALLAAVMIAVPVGALVNFTGPVLGYPVLILLVVVIPTVAMTTRQVRRRRATAVLGYLQQAFRLNLPLEPFIGAAAASEPPPVSRRLYRLREWLQMGQPLAKSLAMAVPELSERSVALIEHAEHTGKVPEVLGRLIDEQVNASRRRRPDRAMEVWYPPLLLPLIGGLIYLMSLFIAPKYRDLFADLHIKMPAFSAWVFDSVEWVQPVFLIILAIFLAACGWQLRAVLTQRRPSLLWKSVKLHILWLAPLAHALLYDRALADLCTALADSVDAGRGFDRALFRAGRLDLPPAVRSRLDRWIAAMSQGEPIDRAARSAGFPALLIGMINPAGGGASLGDALRFLARYYADRSIVRREVIRGVYLPLMTIVMGILVGAVAVGMFLPLEWLTLKLGGS